MVSTRSGKVVVVFCFVYRPFPTRVFQTLFLHRERGRDAKTRQTRATDKQCDFIDKIGTKAFYYFLIY